MMTLFNATICRSCISEQEEHMYTFHLGCIIAFNKVEEEDNNDNDSLITVIKVSSKTTCIPLGV